MLTLMILAITFSISFFPPVHAQSNNEISTVTNASDLDDKAYNPNPLTINQIDTVTWTNQDFVIHTVTEDQGSFS